MKSKPFWQACDMETAQETAWPEIEAKYRAGVLSVRQIAAEHGVSHTAVLKKAKSDSWTRTEPPSAWRRAVSSVLGVSGGTEAPTAPQTASTAPESPATVCPEASAAISPEAANPDVSAIPESVLAGAGLDTVSPKVSTEKATPAPVSSQDHGRYGVQFIPEGRSIQSDPVTPKVHFVMDGNQPIPGAFQLGSGSNAREGYDQSGQLLWRVL
jgi:hypothetical protein